MHGDHAAARALPTADGGRRDTVSGYLTGPRNPAGGSGASRLPPPFSCAGRGPSVGTTARHSRRPVLLPLLFIICRPEPGRRRKLTTTQTQGPVPPLDHQPPASPPGEARSMCARKRPKGRWKSRLRPARGTGKTSDRSPQASPSAWRLTAATAASRRRCHLDDPTGSPPDDRHGGFVFGGCLVYR